MTPHTKQCLIMTYLLPVPVCLCNPRAGGHVGQRDDDAAVEVVVAVAVLTEDLVVSKEVGSEVWGEERRRDEGG